MTLQELRTKLRRSIGNPSTSQVSDGLLDEMINDAQREMSDEFQFRSTRPVRTFSTTAGVDKYELASNETMILRLWDQTNNKQNRIRRVDMREYADAGGQMQEIQGAPRYYIRVQNYLQLIPVPDDVYDLAYYAKLIPDDLVDDSDTPILPIAWHPGIWKLARHHYWDDMGDIAKAQYAYNNYRLWVQRKPDEWADELTNEMEDGGPIPSMAVRRRTDTSTSGFELND